MKYTYLHTNSEYSFLNSMIRMQEWFDLAHKNNIKTLVLTDRDNMFGMGKFLDLANKYNIKAIIGMDVLVDQKARVIVLAKNKKGYILLNNIAYLISKNSYVDSHLLDNEDLIVIDHYNLGFEAQNIEVPVIQNFYFNSKINPYNLKNVVYAPTKQFLFSAQKDILSKLISWKNPESNSVFQSGDYFDENDFYGVDASVLENINTLVDSINIQYKDPYLKLAALNNDYDSNPDFILQEWVYERIKLKRDLFSDEEFAQVYDRVDYELDVIRKMKFSNYFLVIADIIDFANKNDISVGPGRGSASGSLVCFLLGITKINPLRFDLLFERFLNPDRITMPDIDIDIQDDRRDEIANYIANKYNNENVCYISTFQSIGAKMAIRDMGRILNIPLRDVDAISKSIEINETLEQANQKNKVYQKLILKFPELHEYASQIEGLPRQEGIHPAGIIICDQKITNVAPVSYNQTLLNQIQLPLEYLESFGLLKIDFLGLKTLTIIKNIERNLKDDFIFENLYKKDQNILNDFRTLMFLNDNNSEGIFQLESEGMQRTINKVKIDHFDDLYAIISLFRPGPMQYIDLYSQIKSGKKLIKKIWPQYDEIVKNTNGIIVYQEQIMLIAQKLANMSYAQADLLRRAISKKDADLMHKYKQTFFSNGIKNNIPENVLEEVYSNIEKFADYGFNKSHAVAYAFLTFKMAYYKARFPLAFFKALITNAQGAHATINKYVNEAKKQNISVFSPEINKSSLEAKIVNDSIYLSFKTIKGIGEAVVNKIIKERISNGIFSDLYSTYLRLRSCGIGDKALQSLAYANVFRNFSNIESVIYVFIEASQIYELYKKLIDKIDDDYEKFNFINRIANEHDFKNKNTKLKEVNLEFEQKCEMEYLGNLYNTFATKNFEVSQKRLVNVVNENMYVVAEVVNFKNLKNKQMVYLNLMDSSLVIDSFMSLNDYEMSVPVQNKKIYRFLIKKTKQGLYWVSQIKELNNEENVIDRW
ncbi:DNA polymerase III subunit alpha [Mycoplasmopsis ciconiae]|uniref:DNA-directed DNA polymerase n=1 Tax=Mycoplasmopsis ciconiae TaxID=561067 RepID=A0ABU7MKI3_9BACT|nr:DNA polymerase III subunit alpha [Mycoplasmopsis ciconiae]